MTNLLAFPDRSGAFNPRRLVEARLATQLSRAELAREVGISGQAIGYYENGDRRPDMSILLKLAQAVDQPVSFFLRSSPEIKGSRGTRFFRSVGTRSNKVNHALDVKSKWLWELVCLMSEGVRIPAKNLPDVSAPSDHSYSLDDIESIATLVRRHWGLGDGPISNMVALLETHGLIVTRLCLGSEKIDAFSCWTKARPYIFLGSDKQSCSRSRFDAAHELAHILLHADIGQEDLDDRKVMDRIEHEANLFAGAFLFPREPLLREFYSLRVPHLKGLKQRWRVSMQAMAHRAKETGVIDDNQYISFRKQISYHKWLKKEPLDDDIPLEQPNLLWKCWRVFAKAKGIEPTRLEDVLGFRNSHLVALLGECEDSSVNGRQAPTVAAMRE